MKNIKNAINDSISNKDNISYKDKKKLSQEILYLLGALTSLVTGWIYSRLFPDQNIILGWIYLIGIAIIGFPILYNAIKGIVSNDSHASMEILVSIAIIVCVVNNDYVLALVVPLILTLVHFLEEKSIVGSRDAIRSLKKIQSNTAIMIIDGEEKEVKSQSLKIGDVIVVKPGMSLPIDGEIIKGTSSIDQQSLTGESRPVSVSVKDKVYAGTINIEGVLYIKVEKEFKDTSFQRIVNLLEKAQSSTTSETRIIDKFMLYYIPLTLIIAFLVWLFTDDISRSVAVLVVSCPCGHMLVSSAPILSSFVAASKKGILIKNSSFIEKLGDIEYMVFDKTGTITTGTLEAVSYYLEKANSYEDMLKIAGSVAHNSLHPVSKSIILLCKELNFDRDYQIQEIVGKGVIGKKGESEVIIGNYKWISSMGYNATDEYEEDSTTCWIIKDKVLMGCILFKDILRDDAKQMIQELKQLQIKQTIMLTGDNLVAAEKVKNAAGIDTMYSQMLPQQKLDKVKELKSQSMVAVVGDGINDALALSEADVGIAMGAMGSDTAIESADIALMSNSLDNIPYIISLSRKTKKIIMQNILIAFITSSIMILLAASGIVTAIMGALFHNIGAFIILINSGRILKSTLYNHYGN